MSFDLIFSAANMLAMLGWAGLILLPGRKLGDERDRRPRHSRSACRSPMPG